VDAIVSGNGLGEEPVLNTAAWSRVTLNVLDEIQLDPKNVRLETATAQVEADILEDLFANENVLDLVEGISQLGYLDHETPIVVKRRGKYVVVEGNRRLAALKAIQNPMLVPDYQARVASFAKNIPDISTLAAIEVKIAPNQELANQLIAAIHTGNLRKAWTPARQAAFFQTQIDAGRKYKDLLRRYPTIDVRLFVFRAHIVNLFRGIRYDDPDLADFLKSKEWRKGLSTLARIYQSKEFLNLTGLQMDDNGVVAKSISDEHMKEMATIILQGLRTGELNTRSLGTVKAPRFALLMSELRAVLEQPTGGASTGGATGPSPGPTAKGTPGSGSPADQSPPPGASGQPGGSSQSKGAAGKPAPPKKTKVHYLHVSHLVPPAKYPVAISLHLQELSALDIQRFPNAAFLVFRALLEKCVKAYAEAKQVDIKGTGNNTQGYVQLHHALKWFSQYITQNGPKALIQPVTQLRTGKLINYTASNDALNAINHNHKFCVDPDEALNCWNSIDAIMRELMAP
jgi:hypothetical protein